MRELKVPKDALSNSAALEILRVWIKDEQQGLACRADVWDDPAAWGLLLVDIARQVAHAYGQKRGANPASVLSRIREGLEAEWSAPTDAPLDPPPRD